MDLWHPPHCSDDPDGGDGSIDCKTDNATVTWYLDSGGEFELEEPDREIMRTVMREQYGPTHLRMDYDSTPTWSGEAETDIYYQEGSKNLDDSAAGVTWCNDAVVGTYKCDQQYVRIRGGSYAESIGCHETGHAIGLRHGDRANPPLGRQDSRLGCMTTPSSTRLLGSNNVQLINNEWDAP